MESHNQKHMPGEAAGRERREQIAIECEVRQGTRPWKMTRLEDLSPSGFRIAWFPNCRPEIPLRIKIPGMELLTAHVRWQKDGGVGCEFTSALHVAVFEHLVRSARQ